MSPTYLLLFAFSLTILPALHAEKIDNRNFAIDTCFPNPNAIQLAEDRARAYWAKHASRFGAEPRFLAVETSKVFPSEVQELWPKLINSETTASFFSHGKRNSYSNLQLLGVMIFDTRTGRFVSNQGYISVDTPPRGSVARFGPYIARYIGWDNRPDWLSHGEESKRLFSGSLRSVSKTLSHHSFAGLLFWCSPHLRAVRFRIGSPTFCLGMEEGDKQLVV